MRAFVCLLFAVFCAACSPPVDLTKGLEVEVVSSGWLDAGVNNGQNKLVPSVTFTLKNLSAQKLYALQAQALFRRVTENDEWGNGFVIVGSKELSPGETTGAITIKSQLGYTGSDQSRTGHAPELTLRGRESRSAREVRIVAVGEGGDLPDYAPATPEVAPTA